MGVKASSSVDFVSVLSYYATVFKVWLQAKSQGRKGRNRLEQGAVEKYHETDTNL
jgi:hypothetical protein